MDLIKVLESATETSKFKVNNARLSKCGRIFVESQKTRMIIRDTSNFQEAFRFEGEASLLLLSSNFCFFEGKDYLNKPVLGLINF